MGKIDQFLMVELQIAFLSNSINTVEENTSSKRQTWASCCTVPSGAMVSSSRASANTCGCACASVGKHPASNAIAADRTKLRLGQSETSIENFIGLRLCLKAAKVRHYSRSLNHWVIKSTSARIFAGR